MIKNKLKHLALFAACLSTTSFATELPEGNIPVGTRVTITVTKDGTVVSNTMLIHVENNDSVLPTTTVVFPEAAEPTTPQIEIPLQQILSPEELWTAYFNENFLSIRKEALAQTAMPTDLFKRKILGTKEVDIFWPIALENYRSVMHLTPLPPIKKWPIKGSCKKYNKFLLRQVNNLIAKQKVAWLTAQNQAITQG